jgi:hypothetical protein
LQRYIIILTALGFITESEATMGSEHKHTEIIDPPAAISFSQDVRLSLLQTRGDTNKDFPFSKLPFDVQKVIVRKLDGKSAINFSAVSIGGFNLVALRKSVVYSWKNILEARLYARLNTGTDTKKSKVRTVIFNHPISISTEKIINLTSYFRSIKRVISYGNDGIRIITSAPDWRYQEYKNGREKFERWCDQVYMWEIIPVRMAMEEYDYKNPYVDSDFSDSE